ncbi:cysteine synthase A [uncultured Allobaculum sp.]|uniref:cysteine synthase A n=1 Tax=uncultured Allobaculum sp. TaxID=1187017 RepID=UPI002582D34B|nr:cysteine synthase A [uncultured Allobaculum sp.]
MKIHETILDVIGNTPLVEAGVLEQENDSKARVVFKLEALNPGGSAKDRIALHMIEKAEKEGRLKKGMTIIEATSGNTGIGEALVGARKGYRTIIVMPDSMSIERRNLLKAFGAEVVLTKGREGMAGAVAKAEEIGKEIGDVFVPGQFENPDNPETHYLTTGPEIWEDTNGKVDIFVAGVGTGGTLSGVGKYLREKNPNVKIVAVEPAGSPLLSGGKAGPHKLQGIGANFIPDTLDRSIYDEVIEVSDEDALKTGRDLARKEGILAGISSGAAAAAALELASRLENEGKLIVALLPDTGDRYLSSEMFTD